MTVRGVIKTTVVALVALLLIVLLAALLIVRAIVEPDADKFGKVKDEAMQAGLERDHFRAADDEYFVDMDKGLLKPPQASADGSRTYPDEIVALAKATGMSEEQVRKHAVKGQNTWIVWTGGNDRFWDSLTNISFGTFDLLKVISSHGSQAYGRGNRWHYLGLVNEPCFEAATGESAAASDFGLWLDRRDESCAPDPFDDPQKYPGVDIGARGESVTLKNGKRVEIPVGSYYGKPTGILGLRLFSNPDFDQQAAARWDAERYYTDPGYYLDKDLVRPYRVGVSCAFCHVGPSPVNSPPDPESPRFEHVNSNPGAQYFWVNRIFFWDTRPRDADAPGMPSPNEHNLIYQLFHTNPPGTLDTSLVSTDYMNNPRTMNAVYNVGARLLPTLRWGKERLAGDERENKQFQDYAQTEAFADFWNERDAEIRTARVLKDGADSVGILGALNRVYINIGLFSEEWTLHFRPIVGGQKISPIRISDAEKNSAYWGATEDQTADMALFFLATATPDRLQDFPEGERHLRADPGVVERGKVVFARNCAACHSSKIPPAPAGSGVDEGVCADGGNGPQYRECWDRYWAWAQTDEFKAKMTEYVLEDGFLDDNFLSTERRVPVDLLGTNACSPLATNALAGDIWDNFSSDTYKALPPARELVVHHPVSGGASALQPRGAGRGYTRPASLVSLWTSAPYLLGNSVGYHDYPYVGGSYRGSYGDGYGASGGHRYPGDKPSDARASAYADPRYASPNAQAAYAGRYANRCPAPDDRDPYLPCVDNRMRLFDASIRQMLYPDRRRVDTQTSIPVPGYIYRTTAPSCLMLPKGYLPGVFERFPGFFHWAAPSVFAEDGSIAMGPLPAGFPSNALFNTKLLPDNDEPAGLAHYWRLLEAAPTVLGTFTKLGGACSAAELRDPATQAHAERVVRETGLVDTLVGLSKCPDFVVNRGHTFGADLVDSDKEALIEYLKRL